MAAKKKPQIAPIWIKLVRFILAAFILAICYELFFDTYGFATIYKTKQKIEQLKQEEKKQIARLVDLEIEVKRLKTDSLYLEKIARTRYNMGRQDEYIIKF